MPATAAEKRTFREVRKVPLGDMACQKDIAARASERPFGRCNFVFDGSADQHPSNIITELLRGAMFRKYDSQEVDDITSAELAHNILAMKFHRARTDVEVACRFLA
jgi:hypothetical protein